jgi:transcriptional regulator with XRE-family HTH domain
MSNDASSPGDLVRELRRSRGLSQRTLARRAGTTQAQISRIERGEISPGTETLGRLFTAMGERLAIHAEPGPRGNQPTHRLRQDFEQLTAEQRVREVAALSQFLGELAAAGEHAR